MIGYQAILGRRPDQRWRELTLLAMRARPSTALPARVRALTPEEFERWRRLAERNRVGPIVAAAILEALPRRHAARATWQAIYDASARRMTLLLAVLDQVAARLADADIRMVALKNGGIARGIFPDPARCPMGDLDVLIDKRRFIEAHRLILETGFALDSRSDVEPADLERGLLGGGTEYVREQDGETIWFELQWRPIAGRWIRPDQEPDGAALIARSVPIAGTAVRLLSPVDNMLQVALHTAKHTYVRAPGIRLHTDVDRLSAFAPPDWDALVRVAERLRVKTATYFSLALAHALFATAVPDSALAALAPPEWKQRAIVRWLRHVDLFEPDAPKFNRAQMMGFGALLYDDARGLLASALDADPSELGPRHAIRNARRGVRRMRDLIGRYQR